jgi:hypothetical protein
MPSHVVQVSSDLLLFTESPEVPECTYTLHAPEIVSFLDDDQQLRFS